jgi:hypothetical protein
LKVWDEDFVGSVENKSRVRSRGMKWKPIFGSGVISSRLDMGRGGGGRLGNSVGYGRKTKDID